MFQLPSRITEAPGRWQARRRVLLGIVAACLGLPRMAGSSARVIDLGTHLSINGWVVSKRDLSNG